MKAIHSQNSGLGTGGKGFSLIEVVLALGLCSASLFAIVGLLGVSMTASRSAETETSASLMVGTVLTELQSVSFDTLSGNGTPADTLFYFTNEGDLIVSANPAQHSDAFYVCSVGKVADPDFNSTNGTHNLLKLKLHFAWPVTAGTVAKPAGEKSYYVSLARK